MADTILTTYWSAAYKARRGPDKPHWRAFIALQCDHEPDMKLRNLYLNLNEELNNGTDNYPAAA